MPSTPEQRKLGQIRVVLEALVRDLDHEMEAKISAWITQGVPADAAGERWRQTRAGRWHVRLEILLEKLNS